LKKSAGVHAEQQAMKTSSLCSQHSRGGTGPFPVMDNFDPAVTHQKEKKKVDLDYHGLSAKIVEKVGWGCVDVVGKKSRLRRTDPSTAKQQAKELQG
jgi:hypothetical protein